MQSVGVPEYKILRAKMHQTENHRIGTVSNKTKSCLYVELESKIISPVIAEYRKQYNIRPKYTV